MHEGRSRDSSDWNTLRANVFGPGVTAENIDIKEYTSNGKVLSNTFDGSDIKGKNGAISWVAIKGNGWTIADNQGSGCKTEGQGYRVLNIVPGWGECSRLLFGDVFL